MLPLNIHFRGEVLIHVVDERPVAVAVGEQTRRTGNDVIALHPRDVVEPNPARDQTPDVGGVALGRVISPAREVAVLGGHQFGEDALRVEAP